MKESAELLSVCHVLNDTLLFYAYLLSSNKSTIGTDYSADVDINNLIWVTCLPTNEDIFILDQDTQNYYVVELNEFYLLDSTLLEETGQWIFKNDIKNKKMKQQSVLA